MHAILIHGMGRSPLSMLLLAMRLRKVGIQPHLFGYAVSFETWANCSNRLKTYIEQHAIQHDYLIIGHSLGTVLTRGVLPHLNRKPRACFFLAPPSKACLAAKKFAPFYPYQWLMGEMGQLLANDDFMNSLPIPDVPTKIYAGTTGLKLFSTQTNDCILTVEETKLPNIPHTTVPATHTFIMNHKAVVQDIIKLIQTENDMN